MTEAKPLRVAIVGTAPTSRMMAPFADPAWDIWACSAGNVNQLPRVNIWFEMHAVIEMMAPENRAMAEPFFAWLKQKSEAGMFNVVMLELNTFVPKAIPYPRDEMIATFGRNWFTSSIAYMMALAIARGATEIGLFGVDMAAGQEHYEGQRAALVRWREIAHERGIKISIPFESCLGVEPPMYGYWEGTPFGRRVNASIKEQEANYDSYKTQFETAKMNMQYIAGGLEQLRYFQRTWPNGAEIEIELPPEALKPVAEAPVPNGTLIPAEGWTVEIAQEPMPTLADIDPPKPIFTEG